MNPPRLTSLAKRSKQGKEILLTFTSVHVTGHQPRRAPICVLRLQPGDLMAFIIWLAEHRALWAGWRRLGESVGDQAVGRVIGKLRAATNREPPIAFNVVVHEDLLGVSFEAEFASRTNDVASHRFETADDTAFSVKCYRSGDDEMRWEIFETACLHDAREVSRLVTSIVRDRRGDGGGGGCRSDGPLTAGLAASWWSRLAMWQLMP